MENPNNSNTENQGLTINLQSGLSSCEENDVTLLNTNTNDSFQNNSINVNEINNLQNVDTFEVHVTPTNTLDTTENNDYVEEIADNLLLQGNTIETNDNQQNIIETLTISNEHASNPNDTVMSIDNSTKNHDLTDSQNDTLMSIDNSTKNHDLTDSQNDTLMLIDNSTKNHDLTDSQNDTVMSIDDSVKNNDLIENNLYSQYDLKDTKPNLIGSIHFPDDESQYYLRGCKWSPDGTCLLYAIRGNGMSIVELPTDLYTGDTILSNREAGKLKPVITIVENGMLYDFCWYPGMTSQDPVTCCWLTTCQHAPVQLWDAFTGQLRCTYRGYDLVDEVEAALSVNFSHDGKQVYCGYRKALRTFDTNRPGRDFIYYKMSYPVTCIAVNYANPGQLALGSWHKLTELVDDRSGTIRQIKKLVGHFGGVTHLKFSPDGKYLYSGARKDDELICWDMRSPGRPVLSLTRKVDTNQRIYFDISPCGSYIFTGNTNGFLKIWNLLENDVETESKFKEFKYQLHFDCLNSVSVHPYRPIVATGSGQHHFFGAVDDEDNINSIDNSLKIWWIGKIDGDI